jgi:hypothetical protein
VLLLGMPVGGKTRMSKTSNAYDWRLITPAGIPYKLYEGYPRGNFNKDDASLEEKIIIQSKHLFPFVREYLKIGVGKYSTVFEPSMSFPQACNADGEPTHNLNASGIAFEPFTPGLPVNVSENGSWDEDAPENTYCDYLLLTITYTPGKQDEDLIDTKTVSATGEFLLLPSWNMEWEVGENDYKDIETPGNLATKIVPGLEWSFKTVPLTLKQAHVWMNGAEGGSGGAMAMMGKLNNYEVTLVEDRKDHGKSSVKAAIGSLLFAGFSGSFLWSWTDVDNPLVVFSFNLLHKQIDGEFGHNYFFNPKSDAGGSWQKLVKRNAGEGTKYVYDEDGNFIDLFSLS